MTIQDAICQTGTRAIMHTGTGFTLCDKARHWCPMSERGWRWTLYPVATVATIVEAHDWILEGT